MLFLMLLVFGNIIQCETITVKVGILLMTDSFLQFDLKHVGPALEEGFSVAKNVYDVTFNTTYHTYPGVCPLSLTVGHMTELKYVYNVEAVLGPACSEPLASSARLADFFHLPILSGLGDLVKRDTNDMLPTLTILSYTNSKMARSVTVLLKYYQFKHVVVIYDYASTFSKYSATNLMTEIRANTYFKRPYEISFDPSVNKDYRSVLMEANVHARVFAIFMESVPRRELLYTAYMLGMAKGEHVFVFMESFPDFEFIVGDHMDYGITQIYQSLLIVQLQRLFSPEYLAFAAKVQQRAISQFNYTFPPSHSVTYFLTAFYDAVMYLAQAYNLTVQQGGNTSDGHMIATKFWNSSFSGILGTVAVDEFGNRNANFDVMDMIAATSNMTAPTERYFRHVGRYNGATQTYTEILSIAWPKGKPLDVPVCGYIGEFCIPKPADHTVTIAVVVPVVIIAIVAGIAGFFLYRRYKAEQEIGKKSWVIGFSEMRPRTGKFNDSFMSKSCLTVNSGTEETKEQMFCKTCFCRNHVVAIRNLKVKTIELNRTLEVEFRHMQTANHHNLAKFVGACLEPAHLCILMEYCPRGSLQDIIQADSIELDWDFRYSLIQDMIKGMVFLHTSSLGVHGHLSSTNCVIDSRFSLKLTDYGPITLLCKDRDESKRLGQIDGSYNMRKMLWTAPEFLRSTDKPYSVKGDVYSFAIVLQELALRREPYEENNMDIEEIIPTLINKPGTLRPMVNDKACTPELLSLMKSCWAENPHDRPSFDDIEEIFSKMRKGKSLNIMDNLMKRMSNYADNLEQLAAERTKAYLEEKQKVEELLHKLLPSTVAKQLQLGQRVIPEAFDPVTIYFSDIVGFTTICGQSSPIQVVDLLNDLYTAFDGAIAQFKVYKVETIGDAYMCVAGLPERIGERHVTEMCNMALVILYTVRTFKIRHMPDQSLKCRIGLHSGPVVAGVVGLTMPRYCLFGDTVNTASRMESNSEPLKIHISNTTKTYLEPFPAYKVDPRGELQIKGKGMMKTFWLLEMDPHETNLVYPGQVIHPTKT